MDDIKLQKLNLLTKGDFGAFLYDCDGTLADNMQAHKNSYVKAAGEFGFALDPALIDELAGWPTVAVVEEMSRRYQVPLDAGTFANRKGKIFFEEYIEHTQPIPFVVDHLKEHAGKIRIGVVSGGRRHTVEKTLSVLGITHLVETIVCAGETENGKPYPDPFLKAAEELGVAPERCMV
ncbi:MAG: HAD family phosphatase, partial [Sphingobacteriales bacterium]